MPFQPNRRSDEEFGALMESFLPDTRSYTGPRHENDDIPDYFERISHEEDYPLWRIKCRVSHRGFLETDYIDQLIEFLSAAYRRISAVLFVQHGQTTP